MQASPEQAYTDIERAYGQGDFSGALQLAESLAPQLAADNSDPLANRLQLLMGHIHLYGLNQPEQASQAYKTLLAHCQAPQLRQLAEHSLLRCEQITSEAAPAEASTLPATPWLAELSAPQQALRQIQEAFATVVPAAPPEPRPPAQPEEAATPWSQPAPVAEAPAANEEPPAEAEAELPAADVIDAEVVADEGAEAVAALRAEVAKGLLLVRLSSEHSASAQAPS
jgi:hypothetical protein